MAEKSEYLGDKDDYLVWLWRAKEEALQAAIEMDKCVRALRSMGTPWDEIARACGISKQAAWGRWGKGQ
jgi:hypothetical protein